ncbi:S-norcoclaurine synthase [Heracleum sosnowskyi]|uniref:S-norcoclaurine synthase n=1 Tax=Heracleum sosnowskyi TaxID=360622 RepID=A0AAD8HHJ9_9APIA|nr:S-norcoclaurine synthase [Heracleum sosnowskyi]
MFGTISGEVEVNAPASLVWEVYSSLQLAAIVEKGLNDVIEKIEVVEGDGSVGTVLKLLFRPGVVAFSYYKEKFIMIDHEKRVKDVIVVEGGYLDIGFHRYLVRLEVIEKDEKSCITKSTIEYDVKEDYAANASLVSIDPLMVVMKLAAIHILAKTK